MNENADVIPMPEPEEVPETDRVKEIRAALEDHDKVNGEYFAKAYGNLDSYIARYSDDSNLNLQCYPVEVTREGSKEMMLAIPTSNLAELETLMQKMEEAKLKNPKLGKLNFSRVVGANINALVITYGETPEEDDVGVNSESIRAGIEKAKRKAPRDDVELVA